MSTICSMAAALEQLDPGRDVVPAVIDDFVGRAEPAADVAQACAEDRIVAARVDRERRDAQFLQLGNQRLECARCVEVAGDAVEQDCGGRQSEPHDPSLALRASDERSIQPQAIAGDGADEFDVHRTVGQASCLP